MKENIKRMKRFLTKNIRISIIIITLLLGFVILGVSYSYAFFTILVEKKNVISLTAGSISYALTSESMNEQKEVIVGAHSMMTVTVNLKSDSEIDSVYQFYYSGTLPSGVMISYKTEKPDGIIEKGATEVVVLAIENTTSSSSTIAIGVQGGLIGKPMEQEENTHVIDGVYQAKNPTITINTSSVTINAGDNYTILTGVNAKDPYGKDITNKISYTPGNWDNHTIGTTEITYQVTDDYGQSVSATRTITVNKVYVYNRGNYYDTFTGGWQQWFYRSTIADYYAAYKMHSIYTPNMGLNASVVNSNDNRRREVVSSITKNKIDIQNYKKLCIFYNAKEVNANVNTIFCSNNHEQTLELRNYAMMKDITVDGDSQTACVDVNHTVTSCYPAIVSWSKEQGTNVYSSFTVIEMWFE